MMPLKPQYRAGDIVLKELDLKPGSKGLPLAVGDDLEPSSFDCGLTYLLLFSMLFAAACVGSSVGYTAAARDMASEIDQRFICEPRK